MGVKKLNKADVTAYVEGIVNTIANSIDAATFGSRMKAHFTKVTLYRGLSWNNQMLAIAQGATGEVKTFKQWLKVGRCVRKGESSHITLIRPMTYKKDKGTENEREGMFFAGYPVFDISQTDEIEGFIKPDAVEVPDTEENRVLIQLKNSCKVMNVSVQEMVLARPGLYGYSAGGRIVIAENLIPEQKVSTLIHEMAHEILHQNNPVEDRNRKVEEYQAEMVAAVLMDYFGIENDYSAAYMKMYGADREKITATLQAVQEAVSVILKALDVKASEEESDLEVAA